LWPAGSVTADRSGRHAVSRQGNRVRRSNGHDQRIILRVGARRNSQRTVAETCGHFAGGNVDHPWTSGRNRFRRGVRRERSRAPLARTRQNARRPAVRRLKPSRLTLYVVSQASSSRHDTTATPFLGRLDLPSFGPVLLLAVPCHHPSDSREWMLESTVIPIRSADRSPNHAQPRRPICVHDVPPGR
jgi:hypothetical protein